MSPRLPLLAVLLTAFALPAQAAGGRNAFWPNATLTVDPASIFLTIHNFSDQPIELVDAGYGPNSRTGGLSIRVKDPDGVQLDWRPHSEGWWSPAVMASTVYPANKPPLRTLKARERIDVGVTPAQLLARFPGPRPKTGLRSFQVSAIVSLWPEYMLSSSPGPLGLRSNWVPAPCADLFSG